MGGGGGGDVIVVRCRRGLWFCSVEVEKNFLVKIR